MSFLEIYGIGLTLIVALMTLLWLVSLRMENSSIVDIFWGTGFVIAAWLYFALTPEGFLPRKMLLVTLVTVWGLRLSIHILRRNWGKPEDFRYQKWRKEAGEKWWWKSYARVFLLQGVLLWIISDRRFRGRLVDHLQPDRDDPVLAAGFRRGPAGKNPGNPPWL